ncbi:uncharacterized protein LOC143250906 isoform X2 [Tachypleus tridentatus]|uniref:uncharacterized protein LOC143250906 isoform X2 n=1 Tax=Tachypleus tridentatus TaxID=6853 RepID=UPI003FD3BBC7
MDVVKKACFRITCTSYRVTLCVFGSGICTKACTPTSSSLSIRINSGSYFCTSSYFCGANQVNRRGKLLKRFINSAGNTKKKKCWYDSDEQKGSRHVSLEWNTKPVKNQRMKVFNAVLMEAITDIMSTGEISNNFYGHGIEVLGVKVSPDLGNIVVYWTSSANSLATAEELLNSNAGKIRGELGSLSILPNIPRITFVKDLTSAKLLEVQNLLGKADFGPDFQPTSMMHPFKFGGVVNKQQTFQNTNEYFHLSQSTDPAMPESSSSDKDLFQEPKAPDTRLPQSPPEMQHNIFGLDHKALMNQVAQKVARSKINNRRSLSDTSDTKPVQQDQWHLDERSFFKGFDFQVDSGVNKNTDGYNFKDFSSVLSRPKRYKKEKKTVCNEQQGLVTECQDLLRDSSNSNRELDLKEEDYFEEEEIWHDHYKEHDTGRNDD